MSRTQFLQLPDAYSQALIDSLTRQPLRHSARPRPASPTRVAALVVALLLLTLMLPTKQATEILALWNEFETAATRMRGLPRRSTACSPSC